MLTTLAGRRRQQPGGHASPDTASAQHLGGLPHADVEHRKQP